jgi:hypothetical protein
MTAFPRCVCTPSPCTRCRRPATSRDGLYLCAEHWLPRVVADLHTTEQTRRWLAHAAWESMAEGQTLLDAWCGDGRAA